MAHPDAGTANALGGESSFPVLSEDSRSLIEGRINPEHYIAARLELAERVARKEVDDSEITAPRTLEVIAAAIAGLAALAAGLLSLRSETSWLVALAAGVMGAAATTSLRAMRYWTRRKSD